MPSHQLLTSRTVLRPVDRADAADLLALWRIDRVFELMAPDDRPATLDAAGQQIDDWLQKSESDTRHRVWHVASKTGQFVGLVYVKPADGLLQFGGMALPSFWGTGVALESSAAVIEHAFACMGMTSLVAFTHRDNRSARSALLLCGFEQKRAFICAGRPVCAYLLSLTQWLVRRPVLLQPAASANARGLLRWMRAQGLLQR